MKKRVFILGMDGCSYTFFQPYIDQGHLPNLKKLLEGSTRGTLKAAIPPLSPVSWTSIATGVTAAKHGIYDFLLRKEDEVPPHLAAKVGTDAPKLPVFTFAIGGDRHTKAFWEILAERGKKVISLKMPCSYPPDPIKDGIVVSGWDGAREPSKCFYPAALHDEMEKKYGKHYMTALDVPGMTRPDMAANTPESAKKLYDALIAMTRQRNAMFLDLARNKEWDVMFAVFTETDTAQHAYFQHVKSDTFNPIRDVYKEIDVLVGQLLAEFGDTVDFMGVSDHGFDLLNIGVDLNLYLAQKGWVVQTRSNFKIKLFHFLHRFTPLRFLIRHIVNLSWMPKKIASLKPRHLMVDFRNSKVFFEGSYPFFHVLHGVPPEQIFPDLKKDLMALTYEGKPVFEDVQLSKDVFHGPFAKDIPPIIGVMRPEFEASGAEAFMHMENNDQRIFRPHVWNGNHTNDGIFFHKSPKGGGKPLDRNVSVYDITPTLLALLGESIPREMDGKPIVEALPGVEIRHDDTSIYKDPSVVGTTRHTGDDEAAVRERLEALGYL